MAPDVLYKKALRRLKELHLPAGLADIEEFRDKFFLRQWVMFVRDSDQIVDVHLVEPQPGKTSCRSQRAETRQADPRKPSGP
jgi:hypothetical protein